MEKQGQTCLRRRCWGSASRKSQEDGTLSSRSLFPPPSSPLLQPLRPAPECALKHVDRLPPGGDVTRQWSDVITANYCERKKILNLFSMAPGCPSILNTFNILTELTYVWLCCLCATSFHVRFLLLFLFLLLLLHYMHRPNWPSSVVQVLLLKVTACTHDDDQLGWNMWCMFTIQRTGVNIERLCTLAAKAKLTSDRQSAIGCCKIVLLSMKQFVFFLSPSRYMPVQYLKLGHDYFLPDPFQVTAVRPSVTARTVKWSAFRVQEKAGKASRHLLERICSVSIFCLRLSALFASQSTFRIRNSFKTKLGASGSVREENGFRVFLPKADACTYLEWPLE
jgi:hypothetical protein